MNKSKWFSFFLLLLFATSAYGQGAQVAGTISASGSTCTPTTCVPYQLPPGTGSVAIQTVGTFTATLEIEGYVAGGTLVSISSAPITSATVTSVSVIGLTFIQVRASAYTSGSAVVYMRASENSIGGDVTVGDLSVLEAEAAATADGIGTTTSTGCTAGSNGDLNCKAKLLTSQSGAIQTAVEEIAGATIAPAQSTSGLSGNYMMAAVTSATPNLTNGQTAPLFVGTSGNLAVNIAGATGLATDAAEDAAPTSNPLPIGCRYRTTLPSVTAGDMVYVLCTAGGALQNTPTGYVTSVAWGSSVNLAVTNTALVTVSAGTRIVLHRANFTCGSTVSVAVTASLGFAAASLPTTGAGLIWAGLVTGASAFQGIQDGSGWPNVLGVGASDEDLRLTITVPTGGACQVSLTYSTEAT